MSQENFKGIDEYFQTTDYMNLKITPEQNLLVGKNIQFVKGSDFHKGIYEIPDQNMVKKIIVRYYQIAIFDEFGKCAIRSFLFNAGIFFFISSTIFPKSLTGPFSKSSSHCGEATSCKYLSRLSGRG